MPTASTATVSDGELGFSGANWDTYITYRPIYPASFFHRIYSYHAQKSKAAWSTSHDVGAGCGIVASTLASRFSTVVVSDPNSEYITLAQKILTEESPRLPECQFRFLQEGAEQSSVEPGTVDLITVCQSIHWTDTGAAIEEFWKQLKPGGTLMVSHYGVARIVDNEPAQRAWEAIGRVWLETAQGKRYDAVFRIVNMGLDSVGFPDAKWKSVKRMYINAHGSVDAFMTNRRIGVGQNTVGPGEKQVWVEGDKDWWDVQGIEWFKGYLHSWLTGVSEADIQDLWDQFGLAVDGEKVNIETPVAMIFATKE